MTPAQPAPLPRFVAGDPLRALAVLAVFVWHDASRIIIPRHYVASVTFGDAGNRVFGALQLGVYLFFALSGYLLARPFITAFSADRALPDVRTYLRRRLLRIVPAFWLVAAIVLLRHGVQGARFIDVAAIFGFLQSAHIQAVSLPITQAWTLDAEMAFYLLLPLVAFALSLSVGRMPRGRSRLALVVALLGTAFTAALLIGTRFAALSNGEPAPWDMLWAFAPGIALAAVEVTVGPRLRGRRCRLWAAALVVAGVGLLVRVATLAPFALRERQIDGALAGAALVAAPLLLQWTEGWCPRVLDNRVLHWIGQRSYSIYLVHFAVLLELTSIYGAGYGPWRTFALAFVVGLAITLAISHVLYIAVERPFVRLGHRRRGAGRIAVREHSASEPSPALTPPPGNPRFPLMDSVRGIAILLVVVNHCTALTGGWSASGWGHFALYADIGVLVFFVLSGFLLYRPFAVAHAGFRAAPRLGDYVRRRALRIVPGYWLAVTLLAIWPGVPGVFTGDWWRYYFFAQAYSSRTVSHGVASAWSLCVEVTFYLLLPLFSAAVSGFVARRARRPWWQVELVAIGAFAAFGLVSVAATRHYQWPQPLTYTLPAMTEMFALGMGLAVASVAMQGREQASRVLRVMARRPGVSWGLAALFFVIAIYPFDIRTAQQASTLHFVGNRVMLGLAALLLVAPAAFAGGGLVRRVLSWRFLSWIGLISYGIFLWHFALAAWLADFRPGITSPGLHVFQHLSHFKTILFFAATLALSVAVASASYYGVELRFLALKELPLRLAFRRVKTAGGS